MSEGKKDTVRQETSVMYSTEGRFHEEDDWRNYHGPCDTLRELSMDLRYTKKDMERQIKEDNFSCPMSEIAIQIRSVSHTKIIIRINEPEIVDINTIKPLKKK